MRTSLFVLAACVLATFVLPEPASAAPAKVQICHLPPGNPTNVQTITVGEVAVPGHLSGLIRPHRLQVIELHTNNKPAGVSQAEI